MFSRAVRAIPRCSAPYSTFKGSGLAALKPTLQDVAQTKLDAAEEIIEVPIKGVALGRVIRPHELSYENRIITRRFRKRPLVAPTSNQVISRGRDVFHELSLDPLSFATNPLILTEFVTDMGQIKPRTTTRLTIKSQRKLGKAIRRARMMGVVPLLSKWK